MAIDPDDARDNDEAARLRDEVVKRMLATSPHPRATAKRSKRTSPASPTDGEGEQS